MSRPILSPGGAILLLAGGFATLKQWTTSATSTVPDTAALAAIEKAIGELRSMVQPTASTIVIGSNSRSSGSNTVVKVAIIGVAAYASYQAFGFPTDLLTATKQTMSLTVAGLKESAAYLQAHVEKGFNTLTDLLKSYRGEVNAMQDDMNRGLNEVDQQVHQVKARVDELDSSMERAHGLLDKAHMGVNLLLQVASQAMPQPQVQHVNKQKVMDVPTESFNDKITELEEDPRVRIAKIVQSVRSVNTASV